MIRKAEGKDLQKIESLLSEFYHTEGFQTLNIPYDRDSVLDLALRMIIGENGLILVNEKDDRIGGVIGVQMMPFPFNKNYISLVESFWYANDGSGIRLLKAVEKIAIDIGVRFIGIVSICGMKSEKIERVLCRMKYNKLEDHFIKEFE